MSPDTRGFPSTRTLWQGVVLGTIAQAIRVMGDTTFVHEQSWDVPNYSVQNSMGARGTITFTKNEVVGVFFDDDSPRNPFSSKQQYSVLDFTRKMPSNIASLAQNEALQYVLEDLNGQREPVITAAFWSVGDQMTSFEPWDQVVANGAHIVEFQVLQPEEAFPKWQEEYRLSTAQAELMKALYKNRMSNPDDIIRLTSDEIHILQAEGIAGIEDTRELLKALRFEL